MGGVRSRLIRPAIAAGGLGLALAATPALAQSEPMPPVSPAPDAGERRDGDNQSIIVRGYRTEQGLSSPQFTLPLLDTPQTVTVIEDEVLEEQGRRTLRDALRNVTGISIQAGEGNPAGGGDAFSVRGFSAREDVLVDGMRDVGNYFRDPFNTQRIEITKGPASAFAGRGNVGGTVNMVSRRPVLDDGASVELTAGTDNLWRGTVDSNAILSRELGAAIRFNAMANSNDVPGRDYTRNRRWAVNPAVAIGLDTDTEVSLAWLHLEQNDIPDFGIPNVRDLSLAASPALGRPAPVDRRSFYGNSNDYYDIVADSVTLRVDHAFSDYVSLRTQTRYGRTHNDSVPAAPLIATGTTVIDANTQAFNRTKPRNQIDTIWINQTNLTVEFGSEAIWNTLVIGAEFTRERAENLRRNDVDSPLMPLFNPILRAAAPIPYNGTRARLETDSRAGYLFNTMEIGEHFRVVAGLRFDNIDTRVRGIDDGGTLPGYVTDLSVSDSEWSGNAAFIYKPTDSTTVYVAYGTSFEPSGRAEVVQLAGRTNAPPVTAASLQAPPERSDAWELGARTELFNGHATLSAAIFQITRDNARTPGVNPGDPAIVLDGAQRVRGFEAQLVGELTPDWNLIAGYAYMDGETLRSNVPGEAGRRLDNLPRHSFNLWTSYQVTRDLLIGGGIQHVGSRDTLTPVGFFPVTVPAYTVGDLFAEYQMTDNIRLRINVFNVTNEYYFQSFFSNHSIPAPARSASATLTLDF